MITVAVVNHGNYLGLGEQYVNTMRAMVARHLRQPHEFVALTDEGEHGGWWSKIELFRPGRFTGRVLYMDLDSVVVGPLDELVEHRGAIDLTTWGWRARLMCSSVMVWDAGDHDDVYERFTADVRERLHGDQDWITELGGWQSLPAHLCKSYRHHAVQAPPAGCVHVSMHGRPKPHEILEGWVPEKWTIE